MLHVLRARNSIGKTFKGVVHINNLKLGEVEDVVSLYVAI